jgi:hypothetical protein
MTLDQQHVARLRTLWFDLTGELVTMDEAWSMATRLVVFFDVLVKADALPVDNSPLNAAKANEIIS